MVGTEKGARNKVTKRRRGKEGVERGRSQGALAVLKYLCRGPPPRAPSYATADEAGWPT